MAVMVNSIRSRQSYLVAHKTSLTEQQGMKTETSCQYNRQEVALTVIPCEAEVRFTCPDIFIL